MLPLQQPSSLLADTAQEGVTVPQRPATIREDYLA